MSEKPITAMTRLARCDSCNRIVPRDRCEVFAMDTVAEVDVDWEWVFDRHVALCPGCTEFDREWPQERRTDQDG